jgi:hypothetical protein
MMASPESPRLLDAHRALLAYLAAAGLIALGGLLVPGGAWLIDAVSGLTAAAAGFMAFIRLVHGGLHAAAFRVWQAALLLFAAAAIAQFGEAFSATIAMSGAVAGLLLAAALLLLLLAMRFDPAPGVVRATFWLGFLAQATGAAVMLSARSPAAVDFLSLVALLLYLLGAARSVAWARRLRFVLQGRPEEVGDFARYLFTTSRLFKKVRHPRIGNYTVPGHRLVFMVGRFLSWLPMIGPRVRARFGVGIWRQFCDLVVVGIRHGLDAQVYYMFELYRSERRARAAGYLTRYETKNGLFKVLTWQVSKTTRRIMLGDKLGMFRICETHGIPTVPILVIGEDGKLEFRGDGASGLEQDLFIKPRQSKGSKGTEVIRHAGGAFVTEGGVSLDRAGLVAFLERRSLEEPILVQPLIRNHPGLADMADVALMRIRAVTCLDENDKPVLTHAVISNLCKLETNWPTDIEFGAAIDLETGVLGQVTGDKAEMWLDWSDDHPVTRARVRGRTVPCWDQVRSIALAAHAACNDRLLVGWDIAVGPMGALLLEGNSYPDVDFLQRAHQCAIGDSILGPLLYARLAEIERRAATGTLRGPMDFD